MHYVKRVMSVLLVVFVLGCDEQPASDDYFPMQKGLRWRYLVKEYDQQRMFSIENIGKVSLSGRYEEDDIYQRHTSDGTDYYILQDDVGSYRVAQRTVVETKPRFDQTLRKILPSNKDISVGSHWNNESVTYTLRSSAQFSVERSVGRKIAMYFEVVGLDETVTVPAGEFNHCVKVEGSAEFNFYANAATGYHNLAIKQTEWYAPGVGLVKLERDETLDIDLFQGGRVAFELIEFAH